MHQTARHSVSAGLMLLLRVGTKVVVVLIHLLFLTFLKTSLEIFQMDLEGQAEDLRVVEATT